MLGKLKGGGEGGSFSPLAVHTGQDTKKDLTNGFETSVSTA